MATKPNLPNIAEVMESIKSGKIFNEIAKKVTESQIWTSSFRHGYARTCKEAEPESTTDENRELMQSYLLRNR